MARIQWEGQRKWLKYKGRDSGMTKEMAGIQREGLRNDRGNGWNTKGGTQEWLENV
jgi:hypothetical protein